MKFLHSGQVLLSPQTMELHNAIMNLRELNGKPVRLQATTQDFTKGVLLRFPLLMPLSIILRHPQVLTAERFSTRDGEPTRQIVITVRGQLPGSLDLGKWGTFYTRPYSKEPLRCFNCQRFGHYKASCTLPTKCGVCAGSHDTQNCIKKHKEGGETTAHCPNCKRSHHAWNKSCTARREIVEGQRASQQQWMNQHRPSLAVSTAQQGRSALAATSTWGGKTNTSTHQQEPPHSSAPEQFPVLGAAAQQPRTNSRPRQRIQAPRYTTRTHTPSSPEQLTITKTDLQDMLQTFASAIVSMMGKEVPAEAIATLTEKVVAKLPTTSQTTPPHRERSQSHHQRAESPEPNPSQQLMPGATPASAAIEREKLALGLMRNQGHQQPRPAQRVTKTQATTKTTQHNKAQTKEPSTRSKSCSGIAAV